MVRGGAQTSNNGGNQAAWNVPANRFSSLDVTGRSLIEDNVFPFVFSLSLFDDTTKLSAGSNHRAYPLDKAYNEFCKGGYPPGPHTDHVLEYWYEKSKRPKNILFLKYEELKKDPKEQVKKLASFIGRPQKDVEVEEVLWKSCLDRLKDLEVNKPGAVLTLNVPNNSIFKNGVVGD
ncbi:hypothetical protein Ddye_028670 [Dipteronia dyeriana]|uniref:Sulfotransferase n=1 Tax=Dipteronia dyeriana TaxID=168575 RepID=A0AAD9TE62_9ROSI|nr:hypothetical protein Ddye_028670 [Dipteronia dyeriana]